MLANAADFPDGGGAADVAWLAEEPDVAVVAALAGAYVPPEVLLGSSLAGDADDTMAATAGVTADVMAGAQAQAADDGTDASWMEMLMD